jgi:hypothetical protein
MAEVYKNAQVQGTASTGAYATLYNTGAATTAVISSILVTNTSSSAALYRVGIMATAGTPAIANGEWVTYDATIQGNDTVALTLGVVLGNTKYIRVSSSANTVCFNAFVSEIS